MNEDQDEDIDPEYEEALALVGPSVVEVQSPDYRFVKVLKASPEFQRICVELEGKAPPRFMHKSVESFLLWFVPVSLDPPLQELLSATERRKIAERVRKHATGLKESLAEVQQLNGSPAYPFQPLLSRLSVRETAHDYMSWKRYEEYENSDHKEIVHRIRFATYRLVTERIDELFDTLLEAAELFESMPAKLHRPKNANARRLYFLRSMTYQFQRNFGSPCRKQTLSLASIFFDCADLDEAAVSKLAPVEG